MNIWAHGWLAEIQGTRGRIDEAFEEAKKGIEIDPLSSMAHALYGIILSAAGRERLRAAPTCSGPSPWSRTSLCSISGWAWAISAGRPRRRRPSSISKKPPAWACPLPMDTWGWRMPWPAYLKAMVYCGLDRQKEAQAQLEKSSQARDYLLPVTLGLLSMYDFPGVENFVASPRFQALRAKIKVD